MQTVFTLIGIDAAAVWFITSPLMLWKQSRHKKLSIAAKAGTLLFGPAAPVIAWFLDLQRDDLIE